MTRGDRARTAIVEAAEQLFAERGLEGASLREISAAAGQRNNVAAQYHFGDREGLVAAVYAARMRPINERRLRLLARLDAQAAGSTPAGTAGATSADDPPAVLRAVDLVAVLVEPLAEAVLAEPTWYARFLARTLWDPLAEATLARHPDASSLRDLAPRWATALPGLPRDLRRSRLDQLGALVIGSLAGWEWARQRDTPRLAPDHLVADLITTGTGIITAPPPEGTA